MNEKTKKRRYVYRAKTLRGAETRVRQLLKTLREYDKICDRLKLERRTLAKLAAEGPCFYNPLDAMAAEILRDKILRDECRLTPEGKPIG
jgi:hypothetical protein